MTSSETPPGWYPNPSGEPGQRYWDGHNWTFVNVPPKYKRPGWYPDPSGEPGQRYWNGHEWSAVNSPVKDPASSRSAKKALIIALGAVFVLGGGCAILVAVSGNNNNTTQGATTTSTSGQSTKSDEQKLQDELDREAKLFDLGRRSIPKGPARCLALGFQPRRCRE